VTLLRAFVVIAFGFGMTLGATFLGFVLLTNYRGLIYKPGTSAAPRSRGADERFQRGLYKVLGAVFMIRGAVMTVAFLVTLITG
jgi:hypothetical protein